MKVRQQTTGKQFNLVETTANDWKHQAPVKAIGNVFVSEGVGTINGCIACFWIGDSNIDDPHLVLHIAQSINDQDVVGLRFIRTRPTEVHPSISRAPNSSNSGFVISNDN